MPAHAAISITWLLNNGASDLGCPLPVVCICCQLLNFWIVLGYLTLVLTLEMHTRSASDAFVTTFRKQEWHVAYHWSALEVRITHECLIHPHHIVHHLVHHPEQTTPSRKHTVSALLDSIYLGNYLTTV